MIAVSRLTKLYGAQVALRGVTLEVPAGAVLAVLGHNGSGKTTLLRLLATLARPTAGSGRILGLDLVGERERVRRVISLVAHETHLYDDLTAIENLVFAAALGGDPPDRRRLEDALARVGLEAHARTRVRELSSGMRRRVALARAVVRAPRVLLLDEPFAGLDEESSRRLGEFLRAFKAGGGAAVLVTHSLGPTLAVADRVAVLAAGRVAADLERADLDEDAVRKLYLAASGSGA